MTRRIFLVFSSFAASVLAVSVVGGSLPQSTKGQVEALSDLTLSFDAEPAYSEWSSIQPGYKCVNGVLSGANKSPADAFVRDGSAGNARDGNYSTRVVLQPGDHAIDSCAKEGVFAIKPLGEGEGSESWWAWSWKLPIGWRGTDSWGMLFEFTVNAYYWPSYGMLNFDAAKTDSLRLGLHTGLTPDPGSGSYNSAYETWVTLLGPGGPRPMVYGKWLDFYMHVIWRSRTSGLLEIWYREDGQGSFTKLYSDVPGGGALVQVQPHPTLLYNKLNGAPGENGKPGLQLEGGFYRANASWTNEYWWDGMRRRASEAALLAGFPSAASPPTNTLRPVLSGSAVVDQTLATSTGTWSGTPPLSYTFQWRRCDASGNNCTDIAGATKQTYTLTVADVGSKLYAGVTATNAAGSAWIRTYLSAAVAAS